MTESSNLIGAKQLFKMLDDAQLSYDVTHHKPLRTVEDAKSVRDHLDSEEGQIKNLFLKNKKNQMWLLTLHESRKVDLKQAALDLGAKRFSFCSAERLMDYLGVIPGAVSPFGLLNDKDKQVSFYIDEALLEHSIIYAHPMDNRITVSIGMQDMLRFLKQQGHNYNVLEKSVGVKNQES